MSLLFLLLKQMERQGGEFLMLDFCVLGLLLGDVHQDVGIVLLDAREDLALLQLVSLGLPIDYVERRARLLTLS
jgi:hypothetical protein